MTWKVEIWWARDEVVKPDTMPLYLVADCRVTGHHSVVLNDREHLL